MTTLKLPDNLFEGVRTAPIKNAYPDYAAPGRYIVRIDETKLAETSSTVFFSVTFTVLKVLVESPWPSALGHQVGDIANQYIPLKGWKGATQRFQQRMRQFLEGVCPTFGDGVDTEEYRTAVEEAFGEEQPLTGWVVGLDCLKETKFKKDDLGEDGNPLDGKKPWVECHWLEQLDEEQIREMLDEKIIQRYGLLETAEEES